MQVPLAVHICVLVVRHLLHCVFASLLGLGFWYLRVLVTRSFILILIFQREVLYKYYYCYVFVIFGKF